MARRKVREVVAGRRGEPVVTARQVCRAYEDYFGHPPKDTMTVGEMADALVRMKFKGDRQAAYEAIAEVSNDPAEE